jgi:hypothetical protein
MNAMQAREARLALLEYFASERVLSDPDALFELAAAYVDAERRELDVALRARLDELKRS